MTTSTLRSRPPGGHRFHPRLHRPASLAPGALAHGAAEHAVAALDLASALASRVGVAVLRYSLALIFCWFGALKLLGLSPVYNLIGATLPWFNPAVVVPLLGAVEVLLGIGLLIPRARRLVMVALVAHLSGTFLTFLDAPGWMFQGADPLRLTANGEFVLKNLVLISAALVLLGATSSQGRKRWAARTK
jgi:putative oxidoreductase